MADYPTVQRNVERYNLQSQIDDMADKIKRLEAERNALLRDRKSLVKLFDAIFDNVEFDDDDTHRVYIIVMQAKRYLPDKLAKALYDAFDYLNVRR